MSEMLTGSLIRKENVEVAQFDGEWILLELDKNTFTKVNEVGGYVWSIIPDCPTAAHIVDRVHAEYGADRAVVERNVATFINKLVEIGLISFEYSG
ncbi:PqqD family protein [Paenibacillus sediminis]|uniref:PqqD family protein n=1 Tax=Paenibacillus sediminis TaxID=664909 RepID=A0ABS4H4S6_9BACL|nr:PqqD family protein [Paenibacillus sediminis]MBP1937377.1 hypothetical protein [Paenibacillus sediminis]